MVVTTQISRPFSRWPAILVGLSLLLGLFGISPTPIRAQAQDPSPDYLPSFDACPADAIPNAGFRDVSSRHDNKLDIDCIAYYGITQGTSATTYSPGDPVIREHMALFLTRMARLVGIDLPSPGTTPFTDIGHLSQESKDAISQIFQLRITIGATSTTYAPARDVTRGEMALFLSRLMNLMDPVVDGRDAHGYIPADVDDNPGRFDIETPYRDLTALFVETFDAVTSLYELGVGSGTSATTYGAGDDMSRAAMAEFMAGILDHSNLRPAGTTVQVTPAAGLDNFDITMMISVRDSSFAPIDNQPVDWFYTADPEGGLVRGVCDLQVILPNSGDCIWDAGRDDETARDGNIFEDRIEAISGEAMTFYAWIGRRDGEEFDARTVEYSQALARSTKGADAISVTWDDRDIPDTVFRMTDGEYIVDLDIDSIEFTIQLLDELGMPLEMEGIEIDVQVDSDDIVLSVDKPDPPYSAGANKPVPTFSYLPHDDEYDQTVVTDRDGEAVFELFGPRRNHRRDVVTFDPNCQDCDTVTYEFAWSDGDPVLVTARPQFDLFVRRPSSSTISVPVEYGMYDQYGDAVSSTTATRTGRPGTTLRGQLAYQMYGSTGGGAASTIGNLSTEDMTFSRGRFTINASSDITGDTNDGYLVVLTPRIYSDSDTAGTKETMDDEELRYADDAVAVWVVEEATSAVDKATCTPNITDVTTPQIAVYPDRNEFRVCFTLWRYDDSSDRFFVGSEEVGIGAFETALAKETDLSNLTISIYSSRRSGLSVFRLD